METPLVMNSMWGEIDIITTPDSSFYYMNVVADAGLLIYERTRFNMMKITDLYLQKEKLVI